MIGAGMDEHDRNDAMYADEAPVGPIAAAACGDMV